MSAPKWTAGPWLFQKRDGPVDLTLKRTHWHVGQSNAPHLGVAIAFGDGPECHEANARLIAAAPDLYAELANLIDQLDGSAPFTPLERARAVLAKARGDKP